MRPLYDALRKEFRSSQILSQPHISAISDAFTIAMSQHLYGLWSMGVMEYFKRWASDEPAQKPRPPLLLHALSEGKGEPRALELALERAQDLIDHYSNCFRKRRADWRWSSCLSAQR